MGKWLLLEPAYFEGAQLKAATELDDAQAPIARMQQAGLQLRDLTLYPLLPDSLLVVLEIRKAQAKGKRDHELLHLFAALSIESASGGGGGATLSNVAAQSVGTVNGAGVGPQASRDDHTHALPFATVQSVLGAATGAVAFNGQQLTGVADPTAPQAAATKAYVDTAIAGVGASAFSTILQWGSDSVGTTVTARFLSPGYGDSLAPVASPTFRVTEPGILRHLRVKHNLPGVGGAMTYTVYVNNVATLMTCSFNANGTDGNDLSNFVSVVAGDLVAIRVTKAGTLTTSPAQVVATLSLGA